MHVYKIKTQSKENLHGNNTTSFSQLSPPTAQPTVATVERRGDTIHFCGVFSFLSLIFLCNGAGLKRRDTESGGASDTSRRRWWRRGVRGKNPAHLRPTSHSSHASRRAPLSVSSGALHTQARLQSPDVSADGYEAEVSVMMERIRKTRKHSGF